MIGKLTGFIEALGEESLILNVHDVGYVITLSQRDLAALTEGTQVSFFIETQIKDDKIALFGFLTAQGQQWFRLLQTTQGVGAKFALSLLSRFTPSQLYDLILKEARQELIRADGVGPKLAARLITELKDPLLKRPALRGSGDLSLLGSPPSFVEEKDLFPYAHDLLSALVNLGYRKSEALQAIEKVQNHSPQATSLETLLKECLSHLSSH